MKIVTIGRGNIGGGLADLWERAGHQVTRLGREGGDVSDADVVLMAMPGCAIAEAIAKLTGIDGRTVIDADQPLRCRSTEPASPTPSS